MTNLQETFHLKKIFLYQGLLGGIFAAGILYLKGDFISFITGFFLGQVYAVFTFWLILQLFNKKVRSLILSAFLIKWGVLALLLYILLQKVHAISFIVGFMGFVSFWLFLALEDWRKKENQTPP